MDAKEARPEAELSPEVVTEAAAWVARLHGPLRTPAVERGFRNWLNEAADHAKALELVTESWDEVAALKRAANIDITLRSGRQGGAVEREDKRRYYWLAAAAALAVVAAGVFYFMKTAGVATGLGEQRLLALDDGSRIYMNTLTRLKVDYSDRERRIRLDAGEALFEVAAEPDRPFIVVAGDRQVTALGTSFVVRYDADKTAVTLMEGKVAIRGEGVLTQPSHSPVAILSPGDRLTLVRDQAARVDRPSLEKVVAWQRGKVPIENLSLVEAVAEMNRYSRTRLIIERPEAENLRVSGIFRAGDSLSFARAVSQSYGLKVEQGDSQITLAGAPQ